VRDVLEEIHRFMWEGVSREVFDAQDEAKKQQVLRTYCKRVNWGGGGLQCGGEVARGREQRRIAEGRLCGKEFFFSGLKEAIGGSWVMDLGNPNLGRGIFIFK
jgi:hypothetical protein